MRLSIVIPTFKRARSLANLLKSLEKQSLQFDHFEVIVVANFQDQQTEEVVRKSQLKPQFFIAGEQGANRARNLGLAKAKAPTIVFLDDDTYLQSPSLLADLLLERQQNPDLVAIGGVYQLPSNAGLFDRYYHQLSHQWQLENLEQNLVGGFCLYQKNELGHFLKFNEKISFGATETELNLRLLGMGYKMKVLPSLSIEHRTQINFRDFIKKAFYQGMGYKFLQGLLAKRSLFQRQSTIKKNWPNSIYQFFFKTGYRYGLVSLERPLKKTLLCKCLLSEFFQIDSNEILKPTHNQELSYHLTKYPVLKFRQLYHWLKGNFWKARWRFFWFLKWRLIPLIIMFPLSALWMLFPFNMIGLSVPYDQLLRSFKFKGE